MKPEDLPALPPLPKQIGHLHSNGDFCQDRAPKAPTIWPVDLIDEYDVRAYARSYALSAVEAEREACAALIEANAAVCTGVMHRVLMSNAAAIRARAGAPIPNATGGGVDE